MRKVEVFNSKHKFSLHNLFSIFGLMFLANLLVFYPVNATLSGTRRQEFAVNNILFYDPNGCTSAFTTSGHSDGSDVYIIGDSITVNSQSQIKEKLPNATINALSGTYFSHNSDFGLGGTNRIKDMGSQDVLVFAMGTNGGIDQMYPEDTNELFAALSGKNVQVILMTIYYNGFSTGQMNDSNQIVKNLASNYPNITYFDWYGAVSGSPTQYILEDGVHPTDAGKTKFAELIAAAVNKVTKMVGSTASESVSGSGYDRLKSAVREYGEYAMSMQVEYGTPWEVVLAQMQIESGVGTAGIAVSGATNNWLGITGSGDDGSWVSGSGRHWAKFTSVEASIQAWAGTKVLRNGYYNDAFPYLDPNNWDLEAFLVKMISHYAPNSDGNNESAYVQKIITLINGPIREVREEKGWLSSEDFAKQNNIPVGGNNPLDSQISGDNIASSSYSSSYCSDSSNGSTNGGVTSAVIDGITYVFPIAGATKENYLQPGSRDGKTYSVLSRLPCTNYTPGVCHHDYVALDMGINMSMVPGAKTYGSSDFSGSGANFGEIYYYSTGAEVVALVDGTITSYGYYSNKVPSDYVEQCASVSYKGEDGKLYWFGHMSYESQYAAGQSFKAGDVIGHIGPPPCAQSTQAHLHVNIQPGSDNDTYIYDVMNKLYEALPANAAELAARETAASKSGKSNTPIYPLTESSKDIACDPRTRDIGVYTGYIRGSAVDVRLCAVDSIKSSGSESNNGYGISGGNGAIIVNSRVSGAYAALAERAASKGYTLSASSSFRSNSHQEALFQSNGCVATSASTHRCSGTETANPKFSNHQAGYAVDFNVGGWDSSISQFFYSNLKDFGLDRTVNSEPWHVSTRG